ncbi:hypothetical protein MEQU1_001399 [Malassezia equina]|uniref:RRM domain-containing protein n=1 Tax=Malassezia equina TaxID=1381935 RepID=A0AAF0EBY5_9BASI|nr:hypothetical protein MEQU1_001399 [Malassezia equina]
MLQGQLVPAYGFVNAQAAMTYLQGCVYSGHRLVLNWVKNTSSLGTSSHSTGSPLASSVASPASRSDTCLYSVFVGDLSLEIDDGLLAQAFSQFTSLYDARVIRDPKTQISRGFGFVRFKSEADAMESIVAMSGQWLHGRLIRTCLLMN